MPGSDQNINYQIRPSKSIERKMISGRTPSERRCAVVAMKGLKA